jgi:hypothetical protein
MMVVEEILVLFCEIMTVAIVTASRCDRLLCVAREIMNDEKIKKDGRLWIVIQDRFKALVMFFNISEQSIKMEKNEMCLILVLVVMVALNTEEAGGRIQKVTAKTN